MLFYDGLFLLFMLATALGCTLARSPRTRVPLLLVASYVFYGAWDWRFLFLIFGSTLVDFLVAAALPGAGRRLRRGLLATSLGTNLGVLAIFKYLDFGIRSLDALLGTSWGLFELTLPVGISFFTFQSMSYTIDVYRGRLEPERSFARFALFVSFFPQLVAGPIIRAADFLPQIDRALRRFPNRVVEAVPLFVVGLFKKVAIADRLGGIVDPVFAAPELHSGLELWTATLAFTGQIYCDFSGYTDMALALGALFGFRFPANFRAPYLASGPRDFWRRWHVSLSTWLRDYLYIPLGGSRHGRARTLFALAATMLLGGLWHGAAWTFVVWGAYHGALLVAERLLRQETPSAARRCLARLGSAAFLPLTVLGWAIFRAESFAGLSTTLAGLAHPTLPVPESWPIVAAASVFIACEHWLVERAEGRPTPVGPASTQLRFALAGVLLLLAVVLRPPDSAPFIYFQF